MNVERCSRCKFWTQEEMYFSAMEQDGMCRRFPPVKDTDNEPPRDSWAWQDAAFWCFPVTAENGWCGEFKDRVLG